MHQHWHSSLLLDPRTFRLESATEQIRQHSPQAFPAKPRDFPGFGQQIAIEVHGGAHNFTISS